MTPDGKVIRKRVELFVASRTSSPRVCDRRASTTFLSHSTSPDPPFRRNGRITDGRQPVANPSATIARCCGCRSLHRGHHVVSPRPGGGAEQTLHARLLAHQEFEPWVYDQNAAMNAFFVCDMAPLVREHQPKLWIHGHSQDR
jgi:hypothetical protein